MAIALTVDTVLLTYVEDRLHVLLIERGRPPFAGHWALPGGFVEEGEDLEPAARRELAEETNILLPPKSLRQLGAYGRPGRDPRGHTVSVVFLGFQSDGVGRESGGDDASRAAWWPADALPPLAFDHAGIVADALESLGDR